MAVAGVAAFLVACIIYALALAGGELRRLLRLRALVRDTPTRPWRS